VTGARAVAAGAPAGLARLADATEPAVFDVFAGLNEALAAEAAAQGKVHEVARGFAPALPGSALFTAREERDGFWRHAGSVRSVDARAVRLRLDTAGLEEGDRLWVVDPNGPRAFGPYEGGAVRWAPTVEGDTALVVVESGSGETPAVSVAAVSHFYRALGEAVDGVGMAKLLPCNVEVACETDPAFAALASGVGILVVPLQDYDQALCSGTLVNNPATDALEPYFLTANHCVASRSEAQGVDVVWDFRADACENGQTPLLADLPRSSGEDLLHSEPALDLTLMQLDAVPVGAYGRNYAGYSTDEVAAGAGVFGIHHPDGASMKISYGAVTDAGVRYLFWWEQYRVQWTLGVTEGGSSGSPLFLDTGEHLLVGSLSNGPTHSCVDPSGNFDRYGNFSAFYPSVACWLNNADPPEPGGSCEEPGGCPLALSLKDYPETLAGLRAFRDGTLRSSAAGRALVAGYYAVAPGLAEWAAADPARRNLVRVVAAPFAKPAEGG
jgi:hypothetical protein